MTELQATLTMSLFFALRCMVPFLLTLAIGYVMNRLVSRWQAEENAAAHSAPCRKVQKCPPEKRQHCVSFYETQIPCWQMHRLSNGSLPETCLVCPIHSRLAHPTPAI